MNEDEALANSYSPTFLKESYLPRGSCKAPKVIPQIVSGIIPPKVSTQTPSPIPVQSAPPDRSKQDPVA